ncbi:hypothetical protein H0H93_012015 [Arthromyces matolae]|nr:hypothetical protein H0H93_012015 [Arthromyces matolae]
MNNNKPPHRSPNSSLSSYGDAQRARSSSTNQASGSQSIDPNLLAQFAATAVMSSHGLSQSSPYVSSPHVNHGNYPSSSVSGLNEHIFGHGNLGHPQLPPFSSLDFPWHSLLPPDQTSQTYPTMPLAGPSTYPYGSTSPPARSTGLTDTSTSASAVASTESASASNDPDWDQADQGITEEKRRRNTAASARFRIKKKQRNLNLERTVNDLTGRADDLEREAADLRRENGWLKEIVMLKGSRLAGANLASHLMAESAQRASEAQNRSARSSNTSDIRQENSSEDESSDDGDRRVSKKKGKPRKK